MVLADKIIHLENGEFEKNQTFAIELAKNDEMTIFIEGERKHYLHSRFNPSNEAKIIVDSIEIPKMITTVVVIGSGLGYHINTLLNMHPHVRIIIVEFQEALMKLFLDYNVITEKNQKKITNICVGFEQDKYKEILYALLSDINEQVLVYSMPSYEKVMTDYCNQFIEAYIKSMEMIKFSKYSELKFQKLWTMNCIKNFSQTIKAGNFLKQAVQYCKGKPLIVVAAGPSLNDELETLKFIHKNNMAYIFSVGSAINTLVANEIYPHAACGIDPTDPAESNQHVYRILKEENITNQPFIYGTSIGHKTLKSYIGPKWYIITSQDSVTNFLLQDENYLSDATTVAAFVLQLGQKVGFDPIILVGQNLAYLDKQRYSEGIYYAKPLTSEDVEDGIVVKDVYGMDIVTNQGFLKMKRDFELFIEKYSSNNVINTTHRGAQIKGTRFLRLAEVVDKQLTLNDVDTSWLYKPIPEIDTKKIEKQWNILLEFLVKGSESITRFKRILNRIEKQLKKAKWEILEREYRVLDQELKRIEENEAFLRLVLPICRQEYKSVVSKITTINNISDSREKAQMTLIIFNDFIEAIDTQFDVVMNEFNHLAEDINIEKYGGVKYE